MNIRQGNKGSVLIVVSVTVVIILAMIVAISYANNKKKNELKKAEMQNQTETSITTKNNNVLNKEINKEETVDVALDYQLYVKLKNVVGDNELEGDVFSSGAGGNVKASYLESGYLMVASFNDLPDPAAGYFYESWLIREGDDQDTINAGRAEKVNGSYVGAYTSENDITDHDLFILTLEKNDEAKEPSKDRIFEGRLENVEMNDGVPYPL